MNRLFLFMTILVLGVPVYAQSEKRIDTKEKQENVNSRELKKQLAAIQDSINYKNECFGKIEFCIGSRPVAV